MPLLLAGAILALFLVVTPSAASTADYPFVRNLSNPDGTPWTSDSPTYVAVNASGYCFVSDWYTCRVTVFSPSGLRCGSWFVLYSHEIAINSTGYLFVAQWEPDTIAILSPDGATVKTTDYVGGDISGVAINSTDFVFVACRDTPNVQVLDRNGTRLGSFDSGTGATLLSIAVNRTDHVIVGPQGSGTLSILDRDHHPVGPSIPTGFGSVHGLATDAANTIFAVEYGNPVFRVFSPDGRHVGTSSGLFLSGSKGIAVSASGEVVVTDLNGNPDDRVRVFGSPEPTPTPTPVPGPSGSFAAYPESGTAPLTVQFLDYTANGRTWSWNFGDGGSSDQQYPIHVYNQSGLYTVSVTVMDWSGQTVTETKDHLIRVTPPPSPAPTPVADFSANATSGPAPMTVAFTDASSPAPSHRWWQFGDGASSTDANPVHTYTAQGTYTVNLSVWTSLGQATVSKPAYITVGPDARAPVANFTMSRSSGTIPFIVRLTDTSTGNPTSWRWEIPNRGWSTARNATVHVHSPGTYAVTLNATNEYGSSLMTKNITATFGRTMSAKGDAVGFVG
jgi:PKD repeat protein